MSDRWDAVIAGAGPSGSAAATLLARGGYRVALVDRARFPRHKPCGEYLSPGVVQILERLGLAADIPHAAMHRIDGMDIVSRHGTIFPLTHHPGDPAVSIPRYDLDNALLAAAVRAGATLFDGTVVHEPVVENDRVDGLRVGSEGRLRTLDGRMTLVADGSRSVLAEKLGLARDLRWPKRIGLVAHFQGQSALPANRGGMYIGRTGYCGLAPLAGQRVNVAIVVPLPALREAGCSAEAYFDRWIASEPLVREALGQTVRASSVRGRAPIGARAARSWTHGAMLVGDAAGFFDPFTGEGVYRALRGAELAAGAATAVLEGERAEVAVLAGYGRDRRRAFGWKQVTTELVQVFIHYPALTEYILPRLSHRPRVARVLTDVLADKVDARRFVNVRTLIAALAP